MRAFSEELGFGEECEQPQRRSVGLSLGQSEVFLLLAKIDDERRASEQIRQEERGGSGAGWRAGKGRMPRVAVADI